VFDKLALSSRLRNRQITNILVANKTHGDDRVHGVQGYKFKTESKTSICKLRSMLMINLWG
jgi:hypothetical protein